MIKIEKEIRITLYMGIFIVVCNIISFLLDIINLSDLSYIIILIIILILALYLVIKSLKISEKVEKKDEFIKYAEGKADQFGYTCSVILILSIGILFSFLKIAGIELINTEYIFRICHLLWGILIVIRNAYLLKILHKDE